MAHVLVASLGHLPHPIREKPNLRVTASQLVPWQSFQKTIPPFHTGSCFLVTGHMVRPVNSIGTSPLSHLVYHKFDPCLVGHYDMGKGEIVEAMRLDGRSSVYCIYYKLGSWFPKTGSLQGIVALIKTWIPSHSVPIHWGPYIYIYFFLDPIIAKFLILMAWIRAYL